MNLVAAGSQYETKGESDPAVRERGQERDHDCRTIGNSVNLRPGRLLLPSFHGVLTVTQPVESGG
jgi:hypothetical protein